MGDDIGNSQIWPIASLPGKICIDIENISVLDNMENLATCFACQVKTGRVGEGDYFINSTPKNKKKFRIAHQLSIAYIN